MYVSSLLLNPASRRVQRELGNLYELHRSLMSAFPDGITRVDAALLYRLENRRGTVENGISLLVQSSVEPDWHLLQNRPDYLVRNGLAQKSIPVPPSFHGAYRFYLRANPTRRQSSSRKLLPVVHEEQLMKWMVDKGTLHGFEIDIEGLVIRKIPPMVMYKGGGEKKMRIEIQSIDFSGVLHVVDAGKLTNAWQTGIGRGRSFGCGLLSLARI